MINQQPCSSLSRPLTRSVSDKQQKQHSDEQASSDKEFNTTPRRRSQRRNEKPRDLDDYVTYSAVIQEGEPRDYMEAIFSPESDQWKRAMDESHN